MKHNEVTQLSQQPKLQLVYPEWVNKRSENDLPKEGFRHGSHYFKDSETPDYPLTELDSVDYSIGYFTLESVLFKTGNLFATEWLDYTHNDRRFTNLSSKFDDYSTFEKNEINLMGENF